MQFEIGPRWTSTGDLVIPEFPVTITGLDDFPGWTVDLLLDANGQVVKLELTAADGAEVTTTFLRSFPLDLLRRTALRLRGEQLRRIASNEGSVNVSEAIAEQLRAVADAEGMDRLVLHAVTARDYLRACDDPETRSPAKDAADAQYIGVRALQKRLGIAEKLGVFVSAGHGRSGGYLTPVGIAVLEQNGEESQ